MNLITWLVSTVLLFTGSVNAGEWIVTLNPNTTRREVTQMVDTVVMPAIRETNGSVPYVYRYALKGFAIRTVTTEAPILKALRRNPKVQSIEAAIPVRAIATLATGENLTNTWGIVRVGSVWRSDTTAPYQVHDSGSPAPAIAIIDTGIANHPDLNVIARYDCITSSGSAIDQNGHGTHCAGTAAAKNQGSGIVGTAPGFPLVAVKVLDDSGSGTSTSVLCGMDWVASKASTYNIKVASMSLGGGYWSGYNTPITNLANAGVVTVVAAGNENTDLTTTSPAHVLSALSVTAIGETDGAKCSNTCSRNSAAYFSNWLPNTANTNEKKKTTIAGPGVSIYSTSSTGSYVTYSGTSMACPHVAGIMASCLSEGGICRGLTPLNAIYKLVEVSKCVQGTHGWSKDPSCNPTQSRYYGYLAIGDDSLKVSKGALSQCTTPSTCGCLDTSYSAQLVNLVYSASRNTFLQIPYQYSSTNSDACILKVLITGGTGDADLYIRKNAQPSTSNWNWRPYLSGNEETVEILIESNTVYYFGIHAYTSFTSVTFRVEAVGSINAIPKPPPPPSPSPPPPSPSPPPSPPQAACIESGLSCTQSSQCCSLTCGGKPKVCKGKK